MKDRRDLLATMAELEKGTRGGEKYVRWYNQATGAHLALSVPWCAIFVSWCARQAGISTAVLPNFAGCTTGRRRFQKLEVWFDRKQRSPRRGDLIFFNWDGDQSVVHHVGIVWHADPSYVYTVEGNASDRVQAKRYELTNRHILGYAAWAPEEGKEEEEDMTREETKALVEGALVGYAKAPRTYHSLEDIPRWGQDTVAALMAQGRLRGDEHGDLKLTEDMLRVLVVLERKEESHGDGAGDL